MKNPLEPYIGLRSEADWRAILTGLADALAAHTGIAFETVSWYTRGDERGRSPSNYVDVRGAVNRALALDA